VHAAVAAAERARASSDRYDSRRLKTPRGGFEGHFKIGGFIVIIFEGPAQAFTVRARSGNFLGSRPGRLTHRGGPVANCCEPGGSGRFSCDLGWLQRAPWLS
jgi:hypothetical protein